MLAAAATPLNNKMKLTLRRGILLLAAFMAAVHSDGGNAFLLHPRAPAIQAITQIIKRCSGELLLTILAAAALYLLFLAGRRMAVIVEFVVDKIAWLASCTMVAYGLE